VTFSHLSKNLLPLSLSLCFHHHQHHANIILVSSSSSLFTLWMDENQVVGNNGDISRCTSTVSNQHSIGRASCDDDIYNEKY
jgi:hypothetical protein